MVVVGGYLDNNEEDVLAVVLDRKEVHAPALQIVRCANPDERTNQRPVL
jgi:hypothetical protein